MKDSSGGPQDAFQKLNKKVYESLALYRSAVRETSFPVAIESTVYSDNERQWGEIFLPKLLEISPRLLEFAVSKFLLKESLLFLSEKEFELDLFCRSFTGIEEQKSVREMCRKLGYRALEVCNVVKQGKYIGSDYGYHSSDYYETLNYGYIRLVTA